VIELLAPLTVGAQVTIGEGDLTLDPESLAETATKSAATLMIAPTTVWRDMLAATERSWPALKALCVGELPHRDTTRDLMSRTASVWMAQGFREAGIWSTLQRLDGSEPPGLLGRPLPVAHVRILDRDLRDIPLGVVGDLFVGAADPVGYTGTPESGDDFFVAPAEGRQGTLYRTGERARWRGDGRLERTKRRGREVHLNGFRTNLDEISTALRLHPAMDDAAAFLQILSEGRTRLVAYIVPRSGLAYTDTDLRRWLKKGLPVRMIPRAFIEVDSLPRTPDGTIDLEHQVAGEGADEHVAPQTAMEVMLAEVWQEALGLQRVGVHDNFFSLGGYSLLCFQVLERIERETGQRISPRFLLLDSLQQVAARLEHLSQSDQGKLEGSRNGRVLTRAGKLLSGMAYGIVGPEL
jgi:acyl-CoA synthetase (AMP-forming)/AMP-acid ligase II